jgi:DNA end-binding protein Ku
MIVKTLYYHDEIAAVPKQVPKVTLDRNELDMAKMLVDSMTKPFVPEDFKDEYQARLRDAIMKKIQGKEIVTADNSEPGNVIDLMEALQKSLEMSSGKKKKGTA